jgi:uncharacterized protein with FMN-binding domain
MKKFILSMFVIVSFGFYVISQNVGIPTNDLNTPIATISKNSIIPAKVPLVKKKIKSVVIAPINSVPQDNQPLPSTPTPQPQPVIVPKKTGLYNDGEYTGSSVDAYYGNVQVKVSISNGKVTDVVALDYPHDAKNSVRINSRAIPILQQEAIIAQNANIDAVSGASETSPAFIESLTSALNQAKV